MRTILFLAALSSFHTSTEACGWTPPRLELHKVATSRTRAFVVIGDAPTVADQAWQRLDPMSYDNTHIAEVAALPDARELTLVGAQGARTVASTHEVALKDGFQIGKGTKAALEVPGGDAAIALDGKVAGAKWHAIEWTYSPTQQIAGTALDVKFQDGGYTVLSAGKIVSSGTGNLIGAIDANGGRFLVVEPTRGEPVAIYFGAVLPSA
jgi:hypothetical protein